jgi:hypothetical protein
VGPRIGLDEVAWEDNIRLDLKEIGWEDMDWIHLAEDRNQWRGLVYTVLNLRFYKM